MKIYNLAFLWCIPIISGLLFTVFSSSLLRDSHPGTKKEGPRVAPLVVWVCFIGSKSISVQSEIGLSHFTQNLDYQA